MQVEKANGTIVDRKWIPECHTRGELVDIDEHLLHPGKPWRKQTGQSLDEGTAEVATERAENGTERAERNGAERNEQSGTEQGRKKGRTEPEAMKTGRKEDEEATPLRDSSGKAKGKGKGRQGGLGSVTDADVAVWITADVEAAERFLEREGAEPGPGETMRELGVQGVLSCFDFLVEELEAGRSLEDAKDGWVASLPKGIQVVCEQVDGSEDSAVSLLLEMKVKYEHVLGNERSGLEPGRLRNGGDLEGDGEGVSDADTEALTEGDEGEDSVLVLTRQEIAAAKQKLLDKYSRL